MTRFSPRPVFYALAVAACSPRTPTIEEVPRTMATSASTPAVTSGAAIPATAAPVAASPSGRSCGDLGCRVFSSEKEAFAYVLATNPRVLAIGEAHAQKGSEGIDSATKRFREELLPLLRPRATDLVLELLLPPKTQCEQDKARVVEKVERPVTKSQRGDNKNEFTELGVAARALDIVPWVLEPSCTDLARVADAGELAIDRMLTLIAELTAKRLAVLLEKRDPQKLVVAYGGALHNDAEPMPGREAWSFGAKVKTALGEGYVELDLIVPEAILDTDVWQRLPWVKFYDRARLGGEAILFATAPRSFVLVFPASSQVPPAQPLVLPAQPLVLPAQPQGK